MEMEETVKKIEEKKEKSAIWLTKDLIQKLVHMKKYGETYEDVICRMMDKVVLADL